MSGPRVAVVVPCYDDGETLPETLASLDGQEPHELVVVDDGSTDPATLELFDRLGAQGVRVVHQDNAGLSAARMAGVRATSAPYVLPLDADDALGPGALALLADALDADPDAALAWGDIEVFGDLETRLRVAPDLDPWRITYLNDVPVATLVRRDALEAAGGWSMGSGYEDWDLWLALAEAGRRGVHVPDAVLRYRRRGGRMLGGMERRFEETYARLRSRHPDLFARRGATRPRSSSPRHVRLLLPLIDRLPVSGFQRHKLTLLANDPGQVLRLRRLRRAAR
jgi:glycosyltransferase involved in cell wall biosynthesis